MLPDLFMRDAQLLSTTTNNTNLTGDATLDFKLAGRDTNIRMYDAIN